MLDTIKVLNADVDTPVTEMNLEQVLYAMEFTKRNIEFGTNNLDAEFPEIADTLESDKQYYQELLQRHAELAVGIATV